MAPDREAASGRRSPRAAAQASASPRPLPGAPPTARPAVDPEVLVRGREEARDARFLDEPTALYEAVLTWKMVTLFLGLVTTVCVVALALVALRPRPAFITHLEDGVYTPDEVRPDDVKAFAREFVDRIATLRPDEKSLDRHVLEASRYVHPRFLEPWLAVAKDLKFEVLTNHKTLVFDAMETSIRSVGSHWEVRIFGMRKRFLGDEPVGPEAGCCYELAVDPVRPTSAYPRPLSVTRVAQPKECTQTEFDLAAQGTGGDPT